MSGKVVVTKPGEAKRSIPVPGGKVTEIVLSRATVAKIRAMQAKKRARAK
jgi:hypothetical protein